MSAGKHLVLFAVAACATIKPLYNPATHMLKVIGTGISRSNAREYSKEYTRSELCSRNGVEIEAIAGGQVPSVVEPYDPPTLGA